MIITHPCVNIAAQNCIPVKSILEIVKNGNDVFDMNAGKVGGENYTLNQIEQELMSMGDPRIHSSINYASVSSPDLRTQAYVVEKLDSQLDDQFESWMNNTMKGLSLDKNNLILMLSDVFDWFAQDFINAKGSVIQFLVKYAPMEDQQFILQHQQYLTLEYFFFDWLLNGNSK